MKRLFPALFVFSSLFSCKKDGDGQPPVSGLLRLVEISNTNTGSQEVYRTRLDYDAEDRLQVIYRKDGSAPERLIYQISYPEPATARIREIVPEPIYSREIVYKLDGLGRPVVKFERRLLSIDPPSPFQRSVTEFTEFYTYGANGLLDRTVKRYFDSTYAPTTASGVASYRSSDTVIHTNNGGNLAYSLTTGVDTIVSYALGPVSVTIRRERSREDYIYTMRLSLGNYGKNAFLYSDLVGLNASGQPIYLPYLNLANKYVKTSEILDATGVWVPDAESRFEYPKSSVFTFNKEKLITRIQFKDALSGITYTTDYTYR